MLFQNEEDSSGELEALQTDIMRFFAIIAFCLLVIFIPLAKEMPKVKNIEYAVENAKYWQERFEQLLKDVKELATKAKKVNILETKVLELKKNVQIAQKELKEQENNIKAIKKVRIEHKKLEKERKELEKKIDKNIPKKAQIKKKSKEKPKNIIFSSGIDLIELISSKDVSFYVFASQQLFETLPQGIDVKFEVIKKTDFSVRSFVMPKKNVPLKIKKQFLRYYANLESDNTEYYLKFSSTLYEKLLRSMKNNKGGDYVITSKLDIVYRP